MLLIGSNRTDNEDNIRACERERNEQFMSVMPVEESWLMQYNISLLLLLMP